MDSVSSAYFHLLRKKSDPRTSHWFLVSSPMQPVAIIAAYLWIVRKGPGWMKNRPAMDLKPVLVSYNFMLVLGNLFIAMKTLASTIARTDFHLACQPVGYSGHPLDRQLASAVWWFYVSKFVELFDTIFFILRKKSQQVTFLHVYHHAAMPLLWWMCVRFIAGGSTYFSVLVNSLVHVIMYAYYMLAALGPRLHKYLWWKRYLTTVQLVQFAVVILHSVGTIYLDCGYPRAYMVLNSAYLSSLFVLFANFYHKSYTLRRKTLTIDISVNGDQKRNGGDKKLL